MNLDMGDVAGIIAGYKSGQIGYHVAKQSLRSIGHSDDLIDSLLAAGVGLVVGGLVGSAVDGLFDGLFGGD